MCSVYLMRAAALAKHKYFVVSSSSMTFSSSGTRASQTHRYRTSQSLHIVPAYCDQFRRDQFDYLSFRWSTSFEREWNWILRICSVGSEEISTSTLRYLLKSESSALFGTMIWDESTIRNFDGIVVEQLGRRMDVCVTISELRELMLIADHFEPGSQVIEDQWLRCRSTMFIARIFSLLSTDFRSRQRRNSYPFDLHLLEIWKIENFERH